MAVLAAAALQLCVPSEAMARPHHQAAAASARQTRHSRQQSENHTVHHSGEKVTSHRYGKGHGMQKYEGRKHRHHSYSLSHHRSFAINPKIQADITIAVDGNDRGLILSAHNANVSVYPASLTKMMTLYLTSVALERGWIRDDDPLPISTHAALTEPTPPVLRAGDVIKVEQGYKLGATVSSNIAMVALAEKLAPFMASYQEILNKKLNAIIADHELKEALDPSTPEEVANWKRYVQTAHAMINDLTSTIGDSAVNPDGLSESKFAKIMTTWARIMFNMVDDTTFVNASGLPGNTTTPEDLVKLADAISRLPEKYLEWFNLHTYFYVNPHPSLWGKREENPFRPNHNNRYLVEYHALKAKYRPCGTKTGATTDSGLNIAAELCDNANKPYIITVSLGSRSLDERFNRVKELMGDAERSLEGGSPLRNSDDISESDNESSELKAGDVISDMPDDLSWVFHATPVPQNYVFAASVPKPTPTKPSVVDKLLEAALIP